MSQRNTLFSEGEYYHIYNRGNSKQTIFRDLADYGRFQELLYATNSSERVVLKLIKKEDRFTFARQQPLVAIGAYCLMPNHFHVLVTPSVEGGIQNFVQKLSTAYSMYFNKRYERTGGLFEGRFKSEHAHSDEYLKYLFSYIHLNPLKLIDPHWKEKGLHNIQHAREYLDGYHYSSYDEYRGLVRAENAILSKESFPSYFSSEGSFLAEIEEWLHFKEENL